MANSRQEYIRKWREENKEKVKAYNKRYYKNKEFLKCDSIEILFKIKELEKMPVEEVKDKLIELSSLYEKQEKEEKEEAKKLKKILELRIKFEEIEKLMKEIEVI